MLELAIVDNSRFIFGNILYFAMDTDFKMATIIVRVFRIRLEMIGTL